MKRIEFCNRNYVCVPNTVRNHCDSLIRTAFLILEVELGSRLFLLKMSGFYPEV